MNANSIEQVRRLLNGVRVTDAVALVDEAKTLRTAVQIERHLREYYIQNWSSLFPAELLDSRHL
jgi:hypothetical protein